MSKPRLRCAVYTRKSSEEGLERPGLKRLLADIEAGLLDIVVVYKVDLLTLNVLLSFAQFEREVTGERIRDKIAASKKKGMWMGGHVPLGYKARDRTLVIDPIEAKTIQSIFRLYLEHGCVDKLKAAADATGLKSRLRTRLGGALTDGGPRARRGWPNCRLESSSRRIASRLSSHTPALDRRRALKTRGRSRLRSRFL